MSDRNVHPGEALLAGLQPLVEQVATAAAEKALEHLTDVPERREVMDRTQAADFLGISVATLDRLVRGRSLPCHRVGEHRRFLRTKLLEWVERQPS